MTTAAIVSTYWTDVKLVWTPASHGDLEYLLLYQKNVWTPNIVIDNSVKKRERFGWGWQLSSNWFKIWIRKGAWNSTQFHGRKGPCVQEFGKMSKCLLSGGQVRPEVNGEFKREWAGGSQPTAGILRHSRCFNKGLPCGYYRVFVGFFFNPSI